MIPLLQFKTFSRLVRAFPKEPWDQNNKFECYQRYQRKIIGKRVKANTDLTFALSPHREANKSYE